MKCNNCRKTSKCIETFELNNTRYRIYECQECKKRLYTNEIVITEDSKISDFIDKMHYFRKNNDTKRRVKAKKKKLKEL